MKWPVVNIKNEKVGEVDLRDEVFGLSTRSDILHRVVRWQLAKRRSGTHQTRTISMVSGTTKKPYPQKGRGGARHGSLRSPQFRGGAVIFGPVNRDHGYSLPKKVRSLGLKMALSAKVKSNDLFVVDSLSLKSAKTKEVLALLEKNKWESVLFIGGEVLDENFVRSVQNVFNVDVLPQQGANVYSILKRQKLVLTKDALHHLEARLGA